MPEIGDVYRVVAKGRLAGVVETRNMFTYRLASANCTETEVATGLETAVRAVYTALDQDLSTQWTLYAMETQKWYPAVGQTPGYWLGYHSSTESVTGASASDLTGYQPAILMVLKTAFKRAVGKKYFAGLPEEKTLVGALISSFITVVVAAGVFVLASPTFGAGGSADPGILDKTGTFRPFISATVGSIISSMRRRKPGYGI